MAAVLAALAAELAALAGRLLPLPAREASEEVVVLARDLLVAQLAQVAAPGLLSRSVAPASGCAGASSFAESYLATRE